MLITLTPALENLFQTFSTDYIRVVVTLKGEGVSH